MLEKQWETARDRYYKHGPKSYWTGLHLSLSMWVIGAAYEFCKGLAEGARCAVRAVYCLLWAIGAIVSVAIVIPASPLLHYATWKRNRKAAMRAAQKGQP